ncbi:MAG: stage III sporulation protein AB [Oscillospiraceae bacterium]|jgi:stage III sporulation protein AB|nr:stage III sporulation protein AB [Oscillospiraceae bacterium]
MLRTVGAALIGIICVYTGFRAARGLASRADMLRAFIGVTEQMQREIGNRMTALPELIARLKSDRPQLSGFFGQIEEEWNKQDYLGFAEAWRKALAPIALTPEDKLMLADVGGAIGRFDAETQVQTLENALISLREHQQSAEEFRRQNAKLYRTLGFTGGLIAIILVL